MSTVTEADDLDVWERRLVRIAAVIPYVMLAVSLALAWITAGDAPVRGSLVWTTVLGVAAAGWMAAFVGLHPERPRNPKWMGTFFVGLMVFYAVLEYRASVFGFFAFAGYIYALEVLRGRWRYAGIAVTGLISGNAIYGGMPPTRWENVPMYLVVLGVVVLVACTFSFIGDITNQQNEQRKKTVAKLNELNAKLKETMEENAGLHAQLLTQAREAGILDERQRMAREIHDTLAQGLTGIITQVQAAEQARTRPDDWQRHLDNAAALARDSLAEARRTVHAVRPEALETARLPEALAEVVERWSDLNGVPGEVVTTGTARPLHPEIEVTLLRIGQEALANVAKHAGASRVGLTLSYMEDVVTLDVRDNGVGFDLAAVGVRAESGAGGFGLTSMRQRVARLTGTLAVESAPGEGTAISATVPAILPGGDS